MTKICLHCSTPLKVDDKFCGECGEKVVNQLSGTPSSFSTTTFLKRIVFVGMISFVWVWFLTQVFLTEAGELLYYLSIKLIENYPDTPELLIYIYQYMFLIIPPFIILFFIQELLLQKGQPLFSGSFQIILYLIPITILFTTYFLGLLF